MGVLLAALEDLPMVLYLTTFSPWPWPSIK